jgi:hypothetical protein
MPHDDLPSFFFSKFDLTNIRAFYKKKLFKASTGPYEEAGFLDEKVLFLKPYSLMITMLFKNLQAIDFEYR